MRDCFVTGRMPLFYITNSVLGKTLKEPEQQWKTEDQLELIMSADDRSCTFSRFHSQRGNISIAQLILELCVYANQIKSNLLTAEVQVNKTRINKFKAHCC